MPTVRRASFDTSTATRSVRGQCGARRVRTHPIVHGPECPAPVDEFFHHERVAAGERERTVRVDAHVVELHALRAVHAQLAALEPDARRAQAGLELAGEAARAL